jgi:hypothetical protein
LPQADIVPRSTALYKKVNPDMYVDLLPTVSSVSRSQRFAGGVFIEWIVAESIIPALKARDSRAQGAIPWLCCSALRRN